MIGQNVGGAVWYIYIYVYIY